MGSEHIFRAAPARPRNGVGPHFLAATSRWKMRSVRRVLLAVVLAGCVRAPAPLDIGAMVKAKGAVAARQDLEVRALDRPRDVQVHLALARLADDAGRPAQALAELETVLRIGGP